MPGKKHDSPDLDVTNISADKLAAIFAALSADIKTQIASQIEQVIGSLQSDFASRFLSKDDIDVKFDEYARGMLAQSFGERTYKSNVFDFGTALTYATGKDTNQQLNYKLAQIGLDNYAQSLSDERIIKHSKRVQELRHTDIATENQWEDTKELAGDIKAIDGATEKSSLQETLKKIIEG